MLHQSTSNNITVRAKWIVPMDGPPLYRGSIRVRQGNVVEVMPHVDEAAIDLGDYAILPGWINSHTHLEFSDLTSPIPPPSDFPSWIAEVVQHRRRQLADLTAEEFQQRRATSIQRGVNESLQHGVTSLIDTVTQPWDRAWTRSSLDRRSMHTNHAPMYSLSVESDAADSIPSSNEPLEMQVMAVAELMGVSAQRMAEAEALLLDWFAATRDHVRFQHDAMNAHGLSPHAPYTTPWSLIEQAVHWSKKTKGLISMHLAESMEEIEWLERRSGRLAELVQQVPGYLTEAFAETRSVDDYLQVLSTAARSLVIHGNYLNASHMERLARHQDRMAVVYCPRTHALFRHSQYPWRQLRDNHVPVFLGTDSRASNPDLSILSEARFGYRHCDGSRPQEWIEAITIEPARFLGWLPRYGVIRQGSLARFACIPIATSKPRELFEEILTNDAAVKTLWL